MQSEGQYGAGNVCGQRRVVGEEQVVSGWRLADTSEMADDEGVLQWVGRSARRIAVAVLGGVLVVVGVVLSVLPGPGLVLVIAGLAVLATEFAWANSALRMAKRQAGAAGDVVRRRFRQR